MTEPSHHHTLDAQDLLCPEPVMMLHNSIRDAATGEIIKVIATDPSTERDIPKFCEFLGHELLAAQAADGLYNYWIKKS